MKTKRIVKQGKLSKSTWDELALADAEFYILTEKNRKGGKWNKEEFLKTGQVQWREFKRFLSHYIDLQKVISKDNIALDMGCGVGRMTFAMAQDFSKVIGVDVSEEMIKKAKEYQTMLEIDNVEFLVNNGIDLSLFEESSVHFLFSYLTLQHCPSSSVVLNYIGEFSRILESGGVCLFQTRVAPTLQRCIRSFLSKNLRKFKSFFKNQDPRIVKNAFIGNWIYYPKIHRAVSSHFSSFYLLQTPVELYKERFWNLKNEEERWKRSFWICIK